MSLLILGGTSEASRLAATLAERGSDAVLSLAGRTSAPAPSPLPTRVGGFGGAAGLADYLRETGITAVVDATHPFAARISARAVTACAACGVPLVAFSRPPWQAGPGDCWSCVPSLPAAVEQLAAWPSRRVFLTTGRIDLATFQAAPQHRYLVRTIDPPEPHGLPPDTTVVLERGPFAIEAERALMQRHGIEWLVTKNSGAAATAAKLEAARDLGVPVLMVDRPTLPSRPELHALADVLGWIDAHAASPA